MERVHELAAAHADTPPIVLVVEDHDDTLELFDTVLTEQGYWVARAATGLEALECAQDLQPDAIVTDVGLPGHMDGTDLIREIHADPKLCTIPILVVTGRPPRDLPSFAGLPISGLLVKPVPPETLVAKVGHLLQPRLSAPNGSAGTSAEQSERPTLFSQPGVDKKQRRCPHCGRELTWVETHRLRRVAYDYYLACENGCGLSCFNRDTQLFETLFKS